MNNFDMIVISAEKENILVVMKTSEPPFDYLAEIEASLREKHYIGVVMIDELLHSGNTEERFIQGYFDGARFDSGQFAFELVPKKSKLREPVCFYLHQDRESMAVSFKKKIRSNTKSIIAKNGSAFFVHKKEVLLRGKR